MAARCPHYRADCGESESESCHYVQNTTGIMAGAVAAMRALPAGMRIGFEPHMARIQKFFDETNRASGANRRKKR